MKKIALLFSLVVVLFSCSKDSVDASPAPTPTPAEVQPVVKTLTPTFTPGVITFNGELTSLGTTGVGGRGFCWSINANPTYSDHTVSSDGSGVGTFFKAYPYSGDFGLSSTYNVRAYVITNNGNVVYGENVVVNTPQAYVFSIATARNITSNTAELTGNVYSNYIGDSSIPIKGFCVSTSPTPTVSNSTLANASSNSALGDYTLRVSGLLANKTYYARAYGGNSVNTYYSSTTLTFNTVGYNGVSGGFVFFDKGETTDGWRYLEAAPTNMTYNTSTLISWGCSNTGIFQTSDLLGTGLENTNRIVTNCSSANCAARLCYDYSVNGVTDWFLPSINELIYLDLSLKTLESLGSPNINYQDYWSSTEITNHSANTFDCYSHTGPYTTEKSYNYLVRPIRRF